MSSSDNPRRLEPTERAAALRQVVDECLRRRSSGEPLPDEQVIASHHDLLPELELELRKVALVERARLHADDTERLPEVADGSGVAAGLPDWFTGYKPVREIHRGGQGVVYLAIQQSTHRKVAIKVMKEGPFAGPADKARFEREVQILGQLNHPNIVAIHDSGEAAGHFYYVMDYISGQPLDVYVAERQLSVTDTLRLLSKTCDAVNVAHLRGIIHRDLKPGNVRVDANGEPHILDFGLAKAAAGSSDASLMTLTGQFVGSLPWASPEQAEGVPEKIDVRTDVYSLGVILYQILTGQFPYEVSGNVRDVLDRIMHAEPVRPSTVVAPSRARRRSSWGTSWGTGLRPVALVASWGTGLRPVALVASWLRGSVAPPINDEVETIVLKCLQKDRERRYQGAGELARDVRHYLAGEPIEAKRDSVGYVLRKQLRKYKLPTAIVAAFILVVTAGFCVSTMFWRRAAAARDEAAAVRDFLQNMLAAVDPENARGREVTVREVLDTAARQVDARSRHDPPEVEAALRATIGHTYLKLGLYVEAERQLRQAVQLRRQVLGAGHEATAESLADWAWALKELGRYEESEELYREALALRRALFGEEHATVAETLNDLGELFFVQQRYADAEPLFREAFALRRRLPGVEPRDLATSLAELGSLLRDWKRDAGQLVEAEQLLREALALRRRHLGDEHPDTVVSMNKLALLLQDKGDVTAARELFERALELRRRLLGDQHPHVAVSLYNLARALYAEGRYGEAEQSFEQALNLWRAALPLEHERIGLAITNSAAALVKLERFEEAERLLLDRYAELRQAVGPDHPQSKTTVEYLVKLYEAWGKPEEVTRYRALRGTGQTP